MGAPRIVVLGGSSPFAASLLEALTDAGDRLPALDLVLHGRNATALHALARFGSVRLLRYGSRVRVMTGLMESLCGAEVVVHQIRYGDMTGRLAGERFCAERGLLADETLGPAALRTALKSRTGLARTIEAISMACPDAWVLNLVNPLSVTTALICESHRHCVGLCELPIVTAEAAAAALGIELEEMSWEYSGLNHRGFIYALRRREHDPLRSRSHGLEPSPRAGGVSIPRAIPLKDYSLAQDAPRVTSRRAAFLLEVRDRILAELVDNPDRTPPSLQLRDQPWYTKAVIPALEALLREPRELVINLPTTGGIVEEVRAWLHRDGVRVSATGSDPPWEVVEWIHRFRRNERSVMRAVRTPCFDHVFEAMRTDPTIPSERAYNVAVELWNEVG